MNRNKDGLKYVQNFKINNLYFINTSPCAHKLRVLFNNNQDKKSIYRKNKRKEI